MTSCTKAKEHEHTKSAPIRDSSPIDNRVYDQYFFKYFVKKNAQHFRYCH